MLKALLADDERLSLQMMKGIIDWSRYGVQIAATAADGVEALEKFRELSPDLVITDIRMPGLSGLEFIKKVRELNAEVEILLISAYADFGYVKEAIALGCANYLLKPIDEMELERALQQIVKKIANRDISQRLVDKSHELKKKQVLREYMKTGLRQARALEILSSAGIPPSAFTLMDVKLKSETINEYSGVKSVADDQIGYVQERMEEIAGRECLSLIFDLEDYSWTILLATARVDLLERTARAVLEFLKVELGLAAAACFSRSASRPEGLPALYGQTRKLAKYGQFLHRTDVLGYGLNCSEDDVERVSLAEHAADLELSLGQRNAGEAARILREALDEAVRLGPGELSRIYDFCFAAVLKCKGLLNEWEGAGEIPWIENITYARVAANESIDALYAFMNGVFRAVCKVEKPEKMRHSPLVESGIVFLNRNYARNISLEEICASLSVSKNYYSALFKRDAGRSLWAYLTDIRMSKAREMLKTTELRSHEIAYSVGYDNPSYFSKLFKKLHNQTPNEYRAACRKERGER